MGLAKTVAKSEKARRITRQETLMIRSRMTFEGLSVYRSLTAEEIAARQEQAKTHSYIDPKVTYTFDPISFEDAIALLEKNDTENQYNNVRVRWIACYSPDPKSPNYTWSKATPGGNIELNVSNVHALRNLQQMVATAEADGRKNSGYPTKEFYVDFYPAPAED